MTVTRYTTFFVQDAVSYGLITSSQPPPYTPVRLVSAVGMSSASIPPGTHSLLESRYMWSRPVYLQIVAGQQPE